MPLKTTERQLGECYDASPVGIAVALDDPQFADVVAKAVNKLMSDRS